MTEEKKPLPLLLNAKQAAEVLGVSERTFHKFRKHPWMPAAVVLGPTAIRWVRTEIEAAIVAFLPRQDKNATQPPQLVAGKNKKVAGE